MYSITELKKGTLIQLNGRPYQVVEYQHTQLGRGGAIVKTKLKNLLDGSQISQTFKGSEKVESARLDKVDLQYLYHDERQAQFMNDQTYEQFSLPLSSLGNKLNYLVDGQKVVALIFDEKVVDIELPNKISIRVAHTEPGVKGDTATAALKPAQLPSGFKIQVPLFINNGDAIVIDTRTNKYVGRA